VGAKTRPTAPPLRTVVLIGSTVSGALKIRSPAPRTAGRMRRRYRSITPVSTSDRLRLGLAAVGLDAPRGSTGDQAEPTAGEPLRREAVALRARVFV
jgi:hypothetical protein